ncbi:type II toxin-antitoxin system death-on-curing family toxin [Iamia sp. SCSIO 61187]|uniref:type II toxin-antitoxin system death-on-curing family toxin n=1 Tax=Iamia sp. SCSIO 61187 TaxID=2722752 RepID=UPI001C62E6C4|nr:type II toxin-antitoxin system death-on-curing family toxin [Iamia sp. SCSIO 61187]QYG95282.1 type II toxin-antitoxin system death-on-curing family toxin [Iamia sp. SCSIO 61187]
MIHLTIEEVLHIASRVLGGEVPVRDLGLIESAVARPQATVFGEDAYPSIHEKAAALLHSIVQNHALVDGNKRLGLAATSVFYAVNGHRMVGTNDEAYNLVIAVARGELREIADIAPRLAALVEDVR